MAHRRNLDLLALDAHADGLGGALSYDGQIDAGADVALHLLDRLGQGQAAHLLAVDLGDEIAGKDAGLVGGRALEGRDHLDEFVLHGDLDAETAKLAAGLRPHVRRFLGVHVTRMRVEGGQHAVDGRLDQLLIVGLVDILGAHPLEHVAEDRQLTIGIGAGRIGDAGILTDDGDCRRSHQCASEQYRELTNHSSSFQRVRPSTRGRIDRFPVLAEFHVERRLQRTEFRHCHARDAPCAHHRHRFTGGNELPGLDIDPVHSGQDDMIAIARIQDQELTVGPERSCVQDCRICRCRDHVVGPRGDRHAGRLATDIVLAAVADCRATRDRLGQSAFHCRKWGDGRQPCRLTAK